MTLGHSEKKIAKLLIWGIMFYLLQQGFKLVKMMTT